MAIQILTAIGIVILCILLVILLCCTTILFSPIHYEITGGKESDNIFCKLKGHFLFKKIRLHVAYTYGVDPIWKLKVFKKTYGSKKKKKKKPDTPKQPVPEQNLVIAREKQSEIILDPHTLEIELEPEPIFPTAIDLTQLKKEHALDGQEVKRVKLKDIPKTTLPPQTKTVFDIQLKIPKWISNTIAKVKTTIERVTTLKQQVKHLWSQKDVWDALKKLTKRLLHRMKADEVSVVAKIGFADPCVTGQFMGLVSILIGKYGDTVLITPDFEKENFENMQVYIKGRIVIGQLLWCFLQFICHPSIRVKIKEYLKGRK